ncbi:MAG TPA: hypothetical protein VN776_07505 [Terracidiphilus sp.]|nr:hypothetical protein [Terracidiphilus sp.]
MIDPAQLLSNPIAAVGLRAALGAYVIYMARKFYADPTGYFRKSARQMADVPWLAPVIRGLAAFCLWGGCFIFATAIAVQVLGLHGDLLALALITVAAIATWLLLPNRPVADAEGKSSAND